MTAALPVLGLYMTKAIITIFLFSLPAIAFSSAWRCRNNDLEIHCNSGTCQASPADSFTPFDITITDAGDMDICAYSGCWLGRGKVMRSGKHILVSGQGLVWTGTDPDKADFIVALDRSDKVGFIKGAGFAMPIHCKEVK